ncbi:hypothetical protein BaRGS_00016586 [Batillaria attramentaria]|uniref:Uncharacterized protein n=1 Tax=Batillaria attramentaria TaxID=370345 RepID=A0ABD0KY94_9CAEN
MKKLGLLPSFVLAASLLLGLCAPPSHSSTEYGWMTTVPIYDSDVRAVKCTANSSRADLVGLEIYDITNHEEKLVSMTLRKKTCEVRTQPASCVINEDDHTMTLTVVPTDLRRGETRRYRCGAFYFDKVSWTHIFYTNVTLPSKPATTEEIFPVTSTKNDAGISVVVYVAGGAGATVFVVVLIVVGVVKRMRYLAWRATYAQVQRSREQEVTVYRRLGEAVVRDDDANVEEGERFYHEVDDSHLQPEIELRPAVHFRRRGRPCRAPPPPSRNVPLPPLPQEATVIPLRLITADPVDGCDSVRVVKCSADASRDEFVALRLYDISKDEEQSKSCEVGTQPAACLINEEDRTVRITVIPTNLRQGETRQYRCDASYFERVSWTKSFYTNVTLPSKRGLTTVSMDGCETVRVVKCSADMSRSEFVALSIYDASNFDEKLVSTKIRSKRCEVGTKPASCVIGDEGETLTLFVFLTDLRRWETRMFRCDTDYYDIIRWTDTVYANVTLRGKTWASSAAVHYTSTALNHSTGRHQLSTSKDFEGSTITQAPTVAAATSTPKTSKDRNIAPQLAESGRKLGIGTKDSPIKVSKDTDVTFYLNAYPTPGFKSAAFLGKTMLRNNSVDVLPGPETFTENMIRCWPLRPMHRVQCKVDAGPLEEGFHAVTLENEVDEITVFLQVVPRLSEARRTRYSQFQPDRERESNFYRHLGQALLRDDNADVVVDDGERHYHAINDSQLEPELDSWPAANFRRRRRSCHAPPTSHLQVPLPPLPPETPRAVTSLSTLSLPENYLHPAASLSNRRASVNSRSSGSYKRWSLPSDYLHPTAMVRSRRQSLALD